MPNNPWGGNLFGDFGGQLFGGGGNYDGSHAEYPGGNTGGNSGGTWDPSYWEGPNQNYGNDDWWNALSFEGDGSLFGARRPMKNRADPMRWFRMAGN